MSKKIMESQLVEISKASLIPVWLLKAIMEVEALSGGFDKKTDKILIQFEPHIFKRLFPNWIYLKPKIWVSNKVDIQSKEWLAFNEAYQSNPKKAMESTSIGLPQIMGYHFKRLGYATVDAMWEAFKESEYNQVLGLVKFIQTDANLRTAIQMMQNTETRMKGCTIFATYYNGSGFKKLALKLKTIPYDIKIFKALNKYEIIYR